MFVLERLFDVYGPTLVREGERFAKIKALAASLEFMGGVRRVAQVYFFALVATVAFTASTFAIVLYSVMKYAETGAFHWNGFLLFSALVWVGSLGLMVFFLSERRWMDAFGVPAKIDALLTRSALGLERGDSEGGQFQASQNKA